MKKIFAFLLSLGTLTSVFAQKGHGRDNKQESRDLDHKHQDNRQDDRTVYSNKERDSDIKRLNRDHDDQIRAVRKGPWMRPDEKNRQVAMLERQRDQRIQQIRSRFNESRNVRYDDRHASNNSRRY